MSQSGTPDFQKQTQWRSDNLFGSFTAGLPVGDTVTGVKALTNWNAVALRVSSSDNAGYVLLNWYLDSAKTELVDSHQWFIDANTQLSVTVPTRGPFLTITTHNNGPGTMHVTRFACGINSSPGSIDYPVTNNFVSQASKNLAASAQDDFYLPFIQQGPAWVSFTDNSGASHITIQINAFSQDGTVEFAILNVQSSATNVEKTIILPPSKIHVIIKNNDAASSHVYKLAVIPDLR